MINIRIYLRKYSKRKEGVVWFSFYINRERIHFSSKVSVLDKNWDEKKERVRTGDSQHSDKNKIIENIRARVVNVFVKYRLRDRRLSRDTFLRAFNRPDDFATFFEFINQNKKRINYGNELSTTSTHLVIIRKLENYSPVLHFDDIDSEFLDRYYSHLRKDLKNNENTAYKNMAVIKKYVRAAWKMGYMDENPFDNWSIKRGHASYSYLNENELQRMMSAYENGVFESHYHRTLEFFLFMCFSSLHVTDALDLRLEQFANDTFTYYRKKTRNIKPMPIIVPISEPLRLVISNVVGARKKGLVFESMPAPQTMNRYLKEIATELEINKQVTHKVGRHTFATYFLSKTKDLTALKEILGHSELRETLIYAHVLDEDKLEGIKTFDSFVSTKKEEKQ